MALPISIERLLKGQIVENQRIEYKNGWDPEPILHTITAFANDYEGYAGGYVVIGVNANNGIPNLSKSGLPKEEIDHIEGEILEYCKKCITPDYCPTIEVAEVDGKQIIVLWCFNGYDNPYYCKEHVYSKESISKVCYIRKGSSTIKATKEQIQELSDSAQIIPFDERGNRKATINDLKPYIVRDFLSETKSSLLYDFENVGFITIAESMRLLTGSKEDLRPKNAALLMFNDAPENFIPYSYITVDYIPDPTGEGMVTKEFHGPLYRQIRDCLEYMKNQYIAKMTHKYDDVPESKTVENYPYSALEELIPNAALHKDYRIPEPINIRITKEEIQITSFPGFSSSITAERIKQLNFISRSYRNKNIAEFLKDVHLVEAKNTGFPKVIRALKDNGSPMFEIEMPENREYLTIILKIHPDFLKKYEYIDYERGRKTDVFTRIVDFVSLNPNVTLTEIAEALGYESIPNSLRKALALTIAQGKLEKNGKRYRRAS